MPRTATYITYSLFLEAPRPDATRESRWARQYARVAGSRRAQCAEPEARAARRRPATADARATARARAERGGARVRVRPRAGFWVCPLFSFQLSYVSLSHVIG